MAHSKDCTREIRKMRRLTKLIDCHATPYPYRSDMSYAWLCVSDCWSVFGLFSISATSAFRLH